jgi:hypothetical protein
LGICATRDPVAELWRAETTFGRFCAVISVGTSDIAGGSTFGAIFRHFAGEAAAALEGARLAAPRRAATALAPEASALTARRRAASAGREDPGRLASDPALATDPLAELAGAPLGHAREPDAEPLVGLPVAVVVATVAGLGKVHSGAWVAGIADPIAVGVDLRRVRRLGAAVGVIRYAVPVDIGGDFVAYSVRADDEAEIEGRGVFVDALGVASAEPLRPLAASLSRAHIARSAFGITPTGLATATDLIA